VEHRLVSGPIPLYFQLEQILRSRIAGGEFKAEAALPSEDQICSQYGISRITVRRALAALNAQGLITRRRGVGSFLAAQQRGVQPRLTGSLSEFLATAAQSGWSNVIQACGSPALSRWWRPILPAPAPSIWALAGKRRSCGCGAFISPNLGGRWNLPMCITTRSVTNTPSLFAAEPAAGS
jgi:DNA-binding transcriptional regulator YhcF (GntR family)